MSGWRAASLIIGLTLSWSAPAAALKPVERHRLAQESSAPDTPSASSDWYGWQTLLADGAALTLALGSAGLDASGRGDAAGALGFLGGLTYVVASPVVHFEHDQTGKGLASLGLRLVMPLLGVLVGVGVVSDCHGDACDAGAGIAALGIALSPIAIDAALLAYAPRPAAYAAPRAVLTPAFMLNQGELRLGVAGQF
jgi:hypothetical protein